MNLSDISVSTLNLAIKIKGQIEELQSELDRLLGGETSAPTVKRGGKNKMSAAGRRAIAEGQRKRWAKINAGKPGKAQKKKAKRKMSAAGRARIAAAAKARWAKVKAAGKNRL